MTLRLSGAQGLGVCLCFCQTYSERSSKLIYLERKACEQSWADQGHGVLEALPVVRHACCYAVQICGAGVVDGFAYMGP